VDFKVGEKVQAKRDLPGSLFGRAEVRSGTSGRVTGIEETWFGLGSTRYAVRFDTGVERVELTPEDIEYQHGWL
jgi:hypothetical protein